MINMERKVFNYKVRISQNNKIFNKITQDLVKCHNISDLRVKCHNNLVSNNILEITIILHFRERSSFLKKLLGRKN